MLRSSCVAASRSLRHRPLSGHASTTHLTPAVLTSFGWSSPYPREDPNTAKQHNTSIRSYHASSKKEILPLIGVGAVLFVARYSYKALKRMDAEWEDYQWHLKEYELKHGKVDSTEGSSHPTTTLSIDLGTVHMILAHCRYNPSQPLVTPNVVPTHEGGRVTFTGGIVPNDDNSEDLMVGREALGKFYEIQLDHPDRVVWPYQEISNGSSSRRDAVLESLLAPAVTEALERYRDNHDAAAATVRSVVTVPPRAPVEDYKEALDGILVSALLSDNDSSSTTTTTTPPVAYLPEPVAAVWGAQQLTILASSLPEPLLVVDVGGHTTTLSVLRKDCVLATSLLKVGGESFVTEVVSYVLEQHPEYKKDGMAVQRLFLAAEAAVMEFNTKSRTKLHLPYLGMDLETKQPKHLEVSLARRVVEQRVQEAILHAILAQQAQEQDAPPLLSTHVPTPTNLTSLWTSLVTQLLEETELTPLQLSHVLVVGGGAKHPLVAESLREMVALLTGQEAEKFVVPEIAVRSELVALGAASLLPHYDYDVDRGLVRMEE